MNVDQFLQEKQTYRQALHFRLADDWMEELIREANKRQVTIHKLGHAIILAWLDENRAK